MGKTTFTCMLIWVLIAPQAKCQHRISINIPSAKTEAEYIWRTIQDIKFFEENNYQLSLPSGDLMEEIKQKARSGQLSDADYERLEKFVETRVYRKSDYQLGYDKIKNELALIDKMIRHIDGANYSWEFKEFATYAINLTLYGPGGSYDPDEGSILIYTSPKGQFKNYDNPANTIIHEVVHIGIEESIIRKYQVPHTLKERIVDSFVSLHFGQLLPDYKVQDMGDHRTDPYLKDRKDFKDLNEIVDRVLKGK